MSVAIKRLFDTMVDDLLNGNATKNKFYQRHRYLNGIIRQTDNNLVGIIISYNRIYRFIINKQYRINMELRVSEHVICINTEYSMNIFTSGAVVFDYPLIKEVNEEISNNYFWNMILNERY